MRIKFWMSIATLAAVIASGSAWAADFAPVYKAPVPFSWTGCYVGIEGGGAWGRSQHIDVTSPNPTAVGLPITNEFNMSGGLVGGTAGCNYQVSNWVFGVENDISWMDVKGSGPDIAPFNPAVSQTSEKWLDTLRGRIGVAWDRALFYGTGGAAFAGTAVQVCGVNNCVSDSRTRTGWVAGAGIEYAAWEHVTLKLEYLHADFGTSRYIDPPVVVGGRTTNTRDVPLTNDIVRAGVNYKF
jgi:outer membrane immunogenic protein